MWYNYKGNPEKSMARVAPKSLYVPRGRVYKGTMSVYVPPACLPASGLPLVYTCLEIPLVRKRKRVLGMVQLATVRMYPYLVIGRDGGPTHRFGAYIEPIQTRGGRQSQTCMVNGLLARSVYARVVYFFVQHCGHRWPAMITMRHAKKCDWRLMSTTEDYLPTPGCPDGSPGALQTIRSWH